MRIAVAIKIKGGWLLGKKSIIEGKNLFREVVFKFRQ